MLYGNSKMHAASAWNAHWDRLRMQSAAALLNTWCSA